MRFGVFCEAEMNGYSKVSLLLVSNQQMQGERICREVTESSCNAIVKLAQCSSSKAALEKQECSIDCHLEASESSQRSEAKNQSTPGSVSFNAANWKALSINKLNSLLQKVVSRAWCAFGLRRVRRESFESSKSMIFFETVRDLARIHGGSLHKAALSWVCETRPFQPRARKRSIAPLLLEIPDRRFLGLESHAGMTLSAVLGFVTGRAIGEMERRRRGVDVLRFLRNIDASVPSALDVHLVMPNYGADEIDSIKIWLTQRPRFRVCYASATALPPNQIEKWVVTVTD